MPPTCSCPLCRVADSDPAYDYARRMCRCEEPHLEWILWLIPHEVKRPQRNCPAHDPEGKGDPMVPDFHDVFANLRELQARRRESRRWLLSLTVQYVGVIGFILFFTLHAPTPWTAALDIAIIVLLIVGFVMYLRRRRNYRQYLTERERGLILEAHWQDERRRAAMADG